MASRNAQTSTPFIENISVGGCIPPFSSPLWNWTPARNATSASPVQSITVFANIASRPDFVSIISGYEITSHTEVSATYLHNRNLDGWEISNCYEFPGYIRLSLSSKGEQKYGALTTPALTDLAPGSTITVKFDGLRFASNGGIPIKVIGSGNITSAYAVVEGKGEKVTSTP